MRGKIFIGNDGKITFFSKDCDTCQVYSLIFTDGWQNPMQCEQVKMILSSLKGFSLREIKPLNATSSVRGRKENMKTSCYGSNRSTYGYLLPSVSMDIFPYFLKNTVC